MSERAIDRETIEIVEGEESFADRAYRGIEELIVSLQVEPGAILTEQGLSAMLGLGRTPIREALQRPWGALHPVEATDDRVTELVAAVDDRTRVLAVS